MRMDSGEGIFKKWFGVGVWVRPPCFCSIEKGACSSRTNPTILTRGVSASGVDIGDWLAMVEEEGIRESTALLLEESSSDALSCLLWLTFTQDWIKRQRIYFCCAPHLHGQHETWVCMIRCITISFAKTWKVNRLHAVSFALSALICYSRSYEGNPISAFTCQWSQSEKEKKILDIFFFCFWAADLVICQLICSSYVASHSLDTSAGLYTF